MNASRSDLFRKLLEKDADNPMILYSLGNELFKEGRYEEACDLLQRTIENKQDYSVAYRMLGRAHYELHENTEAKSVFLKGKEVAQGNGDLQTVKEIDVFLRRLQKREADEE
jgi:predicted Zn-dependent protease